MNKLIKSRILDEEKITIITNKEKIVLNKEKSEKNISFEDNEEIVLSIIQEQTPRIPIVLLFIANLFVFLIELFLQDTFLRANNKWTTKAKPFLIRNKMQICQNNKESIMFILKGAKYNKNKQLYELPEIITEDLKLLETEICINKNSIDNEFFSFMIKTIYLALVPFIGSMFLLIKILNSDFTLLKVLCIVVMLLTMIAIVVINLKQRNEYKKFLNDINSKIIKLNDVVNRG